MKKTSEGRGDRGKKSKDAAMEETPVKSEDAAGALTMEEEASSERISMVEKGYMYR